VWSRRVSGPAEPVAALKRGARGYWAWSVPVVPRPENRHRSDPGQHDAQDPRNILRVRSGLGVSHPASPAARPRARRSWSAKRRAPRTRGGTTVSPCCGD